MLNVFETFIGKKEILFLFFGSNPEKSERIPNNLLLG